MDNSARLFEERPTPFTVRRITLALATAVMMLASCRPPIAPVAPPPSPPPPAPKVAPQVLDAWSASDHAWAYVDGRKLRDTFLPALLKAAAALRADAAVGIATLADRCGFQPLTSFDELWLELRFEPEKRKPLWTIAFHSRETPDANVRCLHAFVPDLQETALDGVPAWQWPGGFLALNDGVYVVATSSTDVHAVLARMKHPEPGAVEARTTFAGLGFAARLVPPSPLGMEELDIRWAHAPAATHLKIHGRFSANSNARRAETISRDILLQTLGASGSLDPALEGVASRLVQNATLKRENSTLDADLDMAPLTEEPALVVRFTALAVKGVRLYNAWESMGDARDAVYNIARALSDYANRMREAGRSVRFPPSAPLVPDDIPYGKAVVPNARAYSHPSWQDIRYSSERPTFYACDFVTAKDGKSVVVRARGDIDGDGTTSLFELDVRVDPRGVPIIAPIIRERDPEE
jgi:hypothetical protein